MNLSVTVTEAQFSTLGLYGEETGQTIAELIQDAITNFMEDILEEPRPVPDD